MKVTQEPAWAGGTPRPSSLSLKAGGERSGEGCPALPVPGGKDTSASLEMGHLEQEGRVHSPSDLLLLGSAPSSLFTIS